jgi:excisionase family DNA binding protein
VDGCGVLDSQASVRRPPRPTLTSIPTAFTELLSPEEARRRLRMGRTKFNELMRRGEIATVREGRWVRVPATALEIWIRNHLV